MNENEKQAIEEMAFDLCMIGYCKHLKQEECNKTTCAHCEAEALYNAGYRKQSVGHWVSLEEAELMDRFDLAFTCSACGRCDWDCTESESFNFCPNCGAKMKGGE